MAKQQIAHLPGYKTSLQVKPSQPRASTGRSAERAWGSAPPSPLSPPEAAKAPRSPPHTSHQPLTELPPSRSGAGTARAGAQGRNSAAGSGRCLRPPPSPFAPGRRRRREKGPSAPRHGASPPFLHRCFPSPDFPLAPAARAAERHRPERPQPPRPCPPGFLAGNSR